MSAQLILGRQRTLYLGPLTSPLYLSLAASRLLVALEEPIWIRPGHERQSLPCRSALLPVGQRFLVESGRAPVADFHLDVTGTDLQRLSLTAAGSGHHRWHRDLEGAATSDALRRHRRPTPG